MSKIYKIQVNKEMERLHLRYFEDKIKSRIEAEMKKKILADYYNLLREILNKWKDIAVGTVDTLEEIDKILRPLYKRLSEGEQNKLYDIFGYENFKTQTLYDYYRMRAEKNITLKSENYYSKLYNEIIQLLKQDFPEFETTISTKIEKQLASKSERKKFLIEQMEEIIVKDITLQNFQKYKHIFGKEWSPYLFVFYSGIRICPYCNRQYITPIFSTSGKVRAQLDHFMPKKKYPYFSMSLYNLIPCCSTCNSSLKRDKEFQFEDLHPYRDEIGEYLKFGIHSWKDGTVEIKAKDLKDETHVNNYVDMFKLETQYNYHTDIVKKLIRLRYRYSEKQIHNLYEKTKDFFSDEEELKRYLVGGIPINDKYSNEIMSKFRYDIMKELRLI